MTVEIYDKSHRMQLAVLYFTYNYLVTLKIAKLLCNDVL